MEAPSPAMTGVKSEQLISTVTPLHPPPRPRPGESSGKKQKKTLAGVGVVCRTRETAPCPAAGGACGIWFGLARIPSDSLFHLTEGKKTSYLYSLTLGKYVLRPCFPSGDISGALPKDVTATTHQACCPRRSEFLHAGPLGASGRRPASRPSLGHLPSSPHPGSFPVTTVPPLPEP